MGSRNKPYFKYGKGDIKAMLRESKAIERSTHPQAKASTEKAIRKARELDNYKRYLQSIQLETVTKRAAESTKGCFSPAAPVEPQYQALKKEMGVPLVIPED
ncbi:TPA: hypothetical protein OUD88_002884 [Enterobacter hormaechei]|nr:hypothetical protein [Enterobacter hormaechei]